MPILKPCPFCGERAKKEKVSNKYVSNKYAGPYYIQQYRIGCNKCDIWFYNDTEISLNLEGEVVFNKDGLKDIVERWNRRA